MVVMRGWGGSEQGWRKGPWTAEEDKLLSDYISLHGEGRWSSVARCAGLNRSGKSCRLRWVNYLRPGLKRGHITPQEEGIIIELHDLWGNKWSTIARYLPGRTDNEIKNFWRTHFKKKSAKAENKQDRRKNRRNIINTKTEQPENNVSTQENNMRPLEKTTTTNHQPQNTEVPKTSSYQEIESWVDSFAMDGLWGGLWNLDDDVVLQYPYGVDHTVNLWDSEGYIF